MRVFDTFTGYGGFSKAILNVLPSAEIIGFSEIDKYASAVYKYHYPNHKAYGDITKINAEELPDFNLLTSGFPCQSFSIAGKRGGFQDTRGTMFFEIARIIKQKQPRLLLLENVKGLLSHDKGNTFTTIISTLDELGYDCQWQVLNSKDFGVPQNRERVFIIGHLRGTPRPKVFPITESGGRTTSPQEETQGKWQRVRSNDTRIVAGSLRVGGGDTKDLIANTLAKRDHKGGNNLIQQLNKPKHSNDRIRRLTPTECCRLQSIPDNWLDHGNFDGEVKPISDTQKYKMAGNGVTVNVVEAIISSLF